MAYPNTKETLREDWVASNRPGAAWGNAVGRVLNALQDIVGTYESSPSSSFLEHLSQEVNTGSSDTTKNKHVSNALAKGWEDHKSISYSGSPHGITQVNTSKR
jgi:hypothetical protein